MLSNDLAPVFVLAVIGLGLSPLFVAGYMLRQIDQAAGRHEAPVKIWLVDLFSLVFLIQLPLTYVTQWQSEVEVRVVILMAVLFSGVMTLVWWTTIKTVSRAGITRVLWRSAISLIAIPMAYVGSLTMMVITIELLIGSETTVAARRITLCIVDLALAALMVSSILIVKRAIAVAAQSRKPVRKERPGTPSAGSRRIDWED